MHIQPPLQTWFLDWEEKKTQINKLFRKAPAWAWTRNVTAVKQQWSALHQCAHYSRAYVSVQSPSASICTHLKRLIHNNLFTVESVCISVPQGSLNPLRLDAMLVCVVFFMYKLASLSQVWYRVSFIWCYYFQDTWLKKKIANSALIISICFKGSKKREIFFS